MCTLIVPASSHWTHSARPVVGITSIRIPFPESGDATSGVSHGGRHQTAPGHSKPAGGLRRRFQRKTGFSLTCVQVHGAREAGLCRGLTCSPGRLWPARLMYPMGIFEMPLPRALWGFLMLPTFPPLWEKRPSNFGPMLITPEFPVFSDNLCLPQVLALANCSSRTSRRPAPVLTLGRRPPEVL